MGTAAPNTVSELRSRCTRVMGKDMQAAGKAGKWTYHLFPHKFTFYVTKTKTDKREGFEWHFGLTADIVSVSRGTTNNVMLRWADISAEHEVFVQGLTTVLDDIEHIVSEDEKYRAKKRDQLLEDLRGAKA